MTQYDAIVIGTGQSGPSLAKRLAGEGWKVAIIERDKFGGTCVNTGCTPTSFASEEPLTLLNRFRAGAFDQRPYTREFS